MPFLRKFSHLLEPVTAAEAPDYVWLAYAVCAVTRDACGWGGWMIAGAYGRDGQRHPTGTGDRMLPAADEQLCPRCGRETFRTGQELRLEPSADQSPPLREGIDYTAAPIEYEG
jgi:hypothetical protein